MHVTNSHENRRITQKAEKLESKPKYWLNLTLRVLGCAPPRFVDDTHTTIHRWVEISVSLSLSLWMPREWEFSVIVYIVSEDNTRHCNIRHEVWISFLESHWIFKCCSEVNIVQRFFFFYFQGDFNVCIDVVYTLQLLL